MFTCLFAGSLRAAMAALIYFNLSLEPAFAVQPQKRLAQAVPPLQQPRPTLPTEPQPLPVPSPLPPLPKPLPPTPPPTPQVPEIQEETQTTIRIERFIFQGNTVFTDQQLEAITAPYRGRDITFAELLQARAAITQLYIDSGYITSGAFIPAIENQKLQPSEAKITIRIVEGKLETINVQGAERLTNYVRSRLKAATSPVLNEDRLFERLRLLQVDPLIEQISADLIPGSQPDTTILNVQIAATEPIRLDLILNNYRSPAVGSFERGLQFTHANLLGLGDRLSVAYRNTVGSNGGTASYAVPFNTNNGTVQFDFGIVNSDIIEEPFSQLDILGRSRFYELTVRQPLVRTASSQATQEFAVGLTASRQESDSSLLGEDFPVSIGADAQGRTRITALRFFQDYTQRSDQQVLSARSQFNFGLGFLGGTDNPAPPDGNFFSWLGQVQYVRLLAPDTLLLFRGDLQFADRPLVPLEQLSIGGPETVRGYRRDLVLADSGALASVEVRIPIFRSSTLPAVLQLAPFFDFGTAISHSETLDSSPDTLASVGLGLAFQLGDSLTARLDYGIPLFSVDSQGNSLQEEGFSFSLLYNPL